MPTVCSSGEGFCPVYRRYPIASIPHPLTGWKTTRAKCFVVFLRLGRSQAYLFIYELQRENVFSFSGNRTHRLKGCPFRPPYGADSESQLQTLERCDTPGIYTRCAWLPVVLSLGVGGIFFPYTVLGGFGSKNLPSPSPYYAPRVPNPAKYRFFAIWSVFAPDTSRTIRGQSADELRGFKARFRAIHFDTFDKRELLPGG